MLVGGEDGHVRALLFDETGAIARQAESDVGGAPSFLAFEPGQSLVYAVDEGGGTVAGYALSRDTLRLSPCGASQAAGRGPTHVLRHPAGSHVMVASYTDGSVAVFGLGDRGEVGHATDVKASGPRSHQVVTDPSGSFVFVPVLGRDEIAQYRWSSGTLQPNGALKMPPRSGPRHLAFRPDGRFAYAIDELDSTIAEMRFDRATGALTLLGSSSSLPREARDSEVHATNTGAEIAVHPTGAWVYVSNRGHDSIVRYASDPASGRLRFVDHRRTGGSTPRSFGLDPEGKWLAVGNQRSGTVRMFRVDASGALLEPAIDLPLPRPAFVGLFRWPMPQPPH